MNCPLCIDQILTPNHRAGIEIDICPKCRGIWLDRGELERLAGPTDTGAPAPHERRATRGPAGDGGDSWGDDWQDEPRGRRGDDRDDRDDRGGRRRKKSLSERLGDVLGDVLDI